MSNVHQGAKITPSWQSLMQCFAKDREATKYLFIIGCLSYKAVNYGLLNCENVMFAFKEGMMHLELENLLALPSRVEDYRYKVKATYIISYICIYM